MSSVWKCDKRFLPYLSRTQKNGLLFDEQIYTNIHTLWGSLNESYPALACSCLGRSNRNCAAAIPTIASKTTNPSHPDTQTW